MISIKLLTETWFFYKDIEERLEVNYSEILEEQYDQITMKMIKNKFKGLDSRSINLIDCALDSDTYVEFINAIIFISNPGLTLKEKNLYYDK